MLQVSIYFLTEVEKNIWSRCQGNRHKLCTKAFLNKLYAPYSKWIYLTNRTYILVRRRCDSSAKVCFVHITNSPQSQRVSVSQIPKFHNWRSSAYGLLFCSLFSLKHYSIKQCLSLVLGVIFRFKSRAQFKAWLGWVCFFPPKLHDNLNTASNCAS